MMRASPRASRAALLVALVGAGAALRLWGLDFGLPHTLARPDEERVLGSALNVARGELNPGFFSYPSFYVYLVGLLEWLYYAAGRVSGRFASMDAFVASWPVDYEPLWRAGRLLTAAFGTATVWLVYRAGAAAFSRRSGIVGAAFLAVAFLHVRDSHFAVTDVPMTALAVGGSALLLRAARARTLGAFATAGFAAGLATSTKYNAALLIVPAAIAAALAARQGARTGAPVERDVSFGLRALGVFAAAQSLAFVIGTPYALLDFQRFAGDVAFESAHLRTGHAVALGAGWWYHVAVSLRHGLGLPLLCAGLAGIVLAAARDRRAAAVVFSFPLAYYAVAGSGLTVFTRYMTPVVPFLCLAAGIAVDSAARFAASRLPASLRARGSAGALTAAALAVALAAPAALAAIALDRLLAKTDTRVLAARWLLASLPGGATIHQTGEPYGHPQLEVGGQPSRYVHWRYSAERATFTERGRPVAGFPDWIVAQRSPLVAYSAVPPAIEELLATRYTQVASFAGTRADADLVYDQQDAFYLPMRGFDAVTRPGPNLFIYRRAD